MKFTAIVAMHRPLQGYGHIRQVIVFNKSRKKDPEYLAQT